MSLTATIKGLKKDKPLPLLLTVALLLRMISVLFSPGYYAHDDHYLVIQVAQDWVDGSDHERWFVPFEEAVSGRSLLYPGFHYLLFSGMESLGIESPVIKMFVVRLLHALYSLLIVFYAYKITEKLSSRENAFWVGLITAGLWLFPFISVRNLVEIVVAPPLMAAGYLIIKNNAKRPQPTYIWIGILLGISFSLRYQAALVGIGFMLGIALEKNWKNLGLLIIGGLFWVGIFHGYGDYLANGVPFGKIIYYLNDNFVHATSYFKQPWYDFVLLMLAFLVPPISLFLFFGTAIGYKVNRTLFLGVLLFFLLHSMFPNKQERFIFSVLPFFIILGYLGWQKFSSNSPFWQKRKKLMRWLWIISCSINLVALVLISPFSSKQARIDVMTYIRSRGDATGIILDNSERNAVNGLPYFYAGERIPTIKVTEEVAPTQLGELIEREPGFEPNYILFEVYPESQVSKERLSKLKQRFPQIEYLTTIRGSNGDRLRFKLNKIVNNYEYQVYKIN